MGMLATTRMSSKGQVVIPEEVRTALGLEAGAQFVVMGDGDTVVLKRIAVPAKSEIKALVRSVRSAARKSGVRAQAAKAAVRAVRRSG